MASINNLDAGKRLEFQQRLRRIEGQSKGIQRMIDDGRDCVEILDQLAAVKAAVSGLSVDMLETFALYCLRHPDEFATPEEAIGQAVRALARSGR
jgi:CsoR family transcriptional regulator, copper-sensing transcriptional repressor